MPSYAPDLNDRAHPLVKTLAPGTVLWRIHSACFGATAYNPRVSSPISGGRFDATTEDPYGYLYAGSDVITAAAETILRDRPPSPMAFQIPFALLRNKKVSKLEVSEPLVIVALHGEGFPAIGQSDNGLASCGAGEYADTRPWARAIRRWSPTSAGIEYRLRQDDDRWAYVFFGDRCAAGALRLLESHAIDVASHGFTPVKHAVGRLNAIMQLRR